MKCDWCGVEIKDGYQIVCKSENKIHKIKYLCNECKNEFLNRINEREKQYNMR